MRNNSLKSCWMCRCEYDHDLLRSYRDTEETENTYKLPMNIAANGYWASYGLDIILLHEDFSCLEPVGTTGIQRGSISAAASHEKMSN